MPAAFNSQLSPLGSQTLFYASPRRWRDHWQSLRDAYGIDN